MIGAEAAVETIRTVAGDDLIEVQPRALRRLLLTLDDSIQGRIPEILGDNEEERVDTLVRLLRGTSDEDLTQLLAALSAAVERLADERHPRRREQRDRHRSHRRRLAVGLPVTDEMLAPLAHPKRELRRRSQPHPEPRKA